MHDLRPTYWPDDLRFDTVRDSDQELYLRDMRGGNDEFHDLAAVEQDLGYGAPPSAPRREAA